MPSDEAGGVQIDLLLDRADRSINLVEAKFTDATFVFTTAHANSLREKVMRFRTHSATTKQIFTVLSTTFGLAKENASAGIIDLIMTAEEFFGK